MSDTNSVPKLTTSNLNASAKEFVPPNSSASSAVASNNNNSTVGTNNRNTYSNQGNNKSSNHYGGGGRGSNSNRHHNSNNMNNNYNSYMQAPPAMNMMPYMNPNQGYIPQMGAYYPTPPPMNYPGYNPYLVPPNMMPQYNMIPPNGFMNATNVLDPMAMTTYMFQYQNQMSDYSAVKEPLADEYVNETPSGVTEEVIIEKNGEHVHSMPDNNQSVGSNEAVVLAEPYPIKSVDVDGITLGLAPTLSVNISTLPVVPTENQIIPDSTGDHEKIIFGTIETEILAISGTKIELQQPDPHEPTSNSEVELTDDPAPSAVVINQPLNLEISTNLDASHHTKEIKVSDNLVENQTVPAGEKISYKKSELLAIFSKTNMPESAQPLHWVTDSYAILALPTFRTPSQLSFTDSMLAAQNSGSDNRDGGSRKNSSGMNNRDSYRDREKGNNNNDRIAYSNRNGGMLSRNNNNNQSRSPRYNNQERDNSVFLSSRSASRDADGGENYLSVEAENEDGLEPNEKYKPIPASRSYVSIFSKADGAADETEIMIRQANLVLNKLTLTKFEKLSDEFMSFSFNSIERLKRAVELIVSKAQMESNFSSMYADLCKKIFDRWSLETLEVSEEEAKKLEEEEASTKTSDQSTEVVTNETNPDGTESGAAEVKKNIPLTKGERFRVLLLGRCQAEFDVNRVEELEKIRSRADLLEEEKEEKAIVLKKRFNGHMIFIGEIYKKNLIKLKTMEECLKLLINSEEEEDLECMAKLLGTIGPILQKYYEKKLKPKKSKSPKISPDFLEEYFIQIRDISERHTMSRVRFFLKDLIDLKTNNWINRREGMKAVDLNPEEKIVNNENAMNSSTFNKEMGSRPSASNLDSLNPSITVTKNENVVAADEWNVVTTGKKKDKPMSNPSIGGMSHGVNNTSTNNLSGVLSPPGRGGGSVKVTTTTSALSSNARSSMNRNNSRPVSMPNNSAANAPMGTNGSSFSKKLNPVPSTATPSKFAREFSNSTTRPVIVMDNKSSISSQSTTDLPAGTLNNNNLSIDSSSTAVDNSNVAVVEIEPHIPEVELDDATWKKKLKDSLDEYYEASTHINEPILTIQEIFGPYATSPKLPSYLHKILKYLIYDGLDRKGDRMKELTELIIALHHMKGTTVLFTPEKTCQYLLELFGDFNDLIYDYPKLSSHMAVVLSGMMLDKIISLDIFNHLPEDNSFSTYSELSPFIIQILAALIQTQGEDVTRAEYLKCQPNQLYQLMMDSIIVPHDANETKDERLSKICQEYGVTFDLRI